MILYLDDWKKYPHAIADYNTRNESFKKYVMTLQALGVKNCLFPLALHDKSLSGVDPHDPNLTKEQKRRIFIEWGTNPWYFLREIARIDVAGVSGGVKVDANRGIIAQWWCLHNSFDIFMMQPRQTGKSVGMDLHHVDNLLVRRYKSKMLLLTKDRKLMVKNVKKIKALIKLLPPYLVYPSKKDKDVEYMVNYTAQENELNFIITQNSEPDAINAARGHTVEKLHVDEIPFIKYVHKMLPAISSAMDDAIAKAIKNGITYGRAYTTTAGDLSLEHARYAYSIFQNSFPFSEELFDFKDRREVERAAMAATGLPFARLQLIYNHRQLGISDEEFWRRIRSVESTDEDINKDYFLIWGTGGSSSVVSADIIADMQAAGKLPEYVQISTSGHAFKWFIPRDEIDSYMHSSMFILGVDTSNQIGGDATSFELMNAYDLTVAGKLTISKGNIIPTANWLAQFMLRYKNVILMIENKSSAQTFIDATITALIGVGINPFKRIWNRIVDNPKINPEMYSIIQRGRMPTPSQVEDHRKYFGFNTNETTRGLLYSKVIDEATKQSRHVQYDPELTIQLSQLRVIDGRVDHQAGEHDDMVIAWLLAHYVIRYGKNLDVYGIDVNKVMKYITQDGEKITDEQLIEMEYVENLQQDADALMESIKRTNNPSIKLRMMGSLRMILDELQEYGVEPKTRAELEDYSVEQRRLGRLLHR